MIGIAVVVSVEVMIEVAVVVAVAVLVARRCGGYVVVLSSSLLSMSLRLSSYIFHWHCNCHWRSLMDPFYLEFSVVVGLSSTDGGGDFLGFHLLPDGRHRPLLFCRRMQVRRLPCWHLWLLLH